MGQSNSEYTSSTNVSVYTNKACVHSYVLPTPSGNNPVKRSATNGTVKSNAIICNFNISSRNIKKSTSQLCHLTPTVNLMNGWTGFQLMRRFINVR